MDAAGQRGFIVVTHKLRASGSGRRSGRERVAARSRFALDGRRRSLTGCAACDRGRVAVSVTVLPRLGRHPCVRRGLLSACAHPEAWAVELLCPKPLSRLWHACWAFPYWGAFVARIPVALVIWINP